MGTKDVFFRWLSSGGAYGLIAFLWLLVAIFFFFKARTLGKDQKSGNDGCYLSISTTVFTMIGGAIGLLFFQNSFPWYIITSTAGSIVAPWLVCRKFTSGKRKY